MWRESDPPHARHTSTTADKRQSSNLPAGPAVSVNNCWSSGAPGSARPMMPGILARCSRPGTRRAGNLRRQNAQIAFWTVSFLKKCGGLLRAPNRTGRAGTGYRGGEGHRSMSPDIAACWRCHGQEFTNGAGPVRPALRHRGSGVPNWTPRSSTSTRPPAALTAPRSWPDPASPTVSGYREATRSAPVPEERPDQAPRWPARLSG